MHKVVEGSSGLTSEKVVEVLREVVEGEMMHRLIWCPYLPELVMADIWSLDLVVDEY